MKSFVEEPRTAHPRTASSPPHSRAARQSALLDAALLETFPASDPVSVVLVD